MKSYEQKLVLVGLYTLAISAIFGLISVLILGNLPSVEQPTQWAETVSGNAYTASYYILIYAYLIGIIGFWALHRLFSSEKAQYLLSFWAMILSILGSALPVASIGVSAFAYPSIARMYLSHGVDVALLTQDMFTSKVMIFLLFSGLYYLTGIILFGIVLWKNREPMLKLASISILLHGILIIMPDHTYINLLSWIFLLASSVMLIVYSYRSRRE